MCTTSRETRPAQVVVSDRSVTRLPQHTEAPHRSACRVGGRTLHTNRSHPGSAYIHTAQAQRRVQPPVKRIERVQHLPHWRSNPDLKRQACPHVLPGTKRLLGGQFRRHQQEHEHTCSQPQTSQTGAQCRPLVHPAQPRGLPQHSESTAPPPACVSVAKQHNRFELQN